MIDEMDWKAAMNSEIFREYVSNELNREAQEKAERPQKEATALKKEMEHREKVLDAFADFEKELKSKPLLLNKFKQARQILLNNPEIADKTDPKFIDGIMMLDLGEE